MEPGRTAAPVEPDGGPDAAPPRRRRRRLLVLGAVVLVVLGALAFWWATPSGSPPLTRADVDQAVQRGIDQEKQQERAAPADGTSAYRTIGPSLVTVTAQRGGGVELGAGTVVNARGTVLTALHVVDGAAQVQVQFADGTRSGARVVTSQRDHDIAVLAPDRLPEVVVPAVLGGPPPVGDTVFAVGNPLGLLRSLTAGVVSATDRRIAAPQGAGPQGAGPQGPAQGAALSGLIQFDAAVNPGNSGGPLLNRAGQVVGVVTALANPAGEDFFIGVGFAVPIATAGGAAGGPQQ